MNRRELLMGVSATAMAGVPREPLGGLSSFSGWVPVADVSAGQLIVGFYYHLCWNGNDWFINGELQGKGQT